LHNIKLHSTDETICPLRFVNSNRECPEQMNAALEISRVQFLLPSESHLKET